MSLAMQRYETWRSQPGLDATLSKELSAMEGDAEKILDSFGCDLAFGTAGLRGVLGAGTNRMNIYTVARATQGLASWLAGTSLPQKVAIAYDSRVGSTLFSKVAAQVLAANGMTVYLYPRLEPTPALSFAVRYYGCGAGINVTASHNPAQYNGYKVYGADGCQIGPETADAVLAIIETLDYFTGPKYMDFDEAKRAGKIIEIPDSCLEAFVDAVYAQRVGGGEGIEELKLVYTPLNGAGLECIRMLAKKLGVKNMTVVPEQEQPDGNFPTCPYCPSALENVRSSIEPVSSSSVTYAIIDWFFVVFILTFWTMPAIFTTCSSWNSSVCSEKLSRIAPMLTTFAPRSFSR